jgi:hypothetical protein
LLANHPMWGKLALPLLARLYVRQKDIDTLPDHYEWPFRSSSPGQLPSRGPPRSGLGDFHHPAPP